MFVGISVFVFVGCWHCWNLVVVGFFGLFASHSPLSLSGKY